jgi:hypothetical protein
MPVGIKIKNFRVRSLDIDFNELAWELKDTTEDALDYTFQVLRAESPMGLFTHISQPFSDRYSFIDNAILIGDKWRQYHYRLLITNLLTGETEESVTTVKEPEPDLAALEIRRHMQILFREHAGRRIWLLPSRQSGQRCECWAPRLKQRVRSGCALCFDTGYVRGYYNPIETFGQIDPSPKANQNTNLGAQQQTNTTGRFPDYPPLKPDDVLVELENRRWKVVTVTSTEKGRAVVHQEVTLHEIPRSDMEYSIPLKLNEATKDLWATPPRNYTNPHNLANVAADDRLLALYQSRKP